MFIIYKKFIFFSFQENMLAKNNYFNLHTRLASFFIYKIKNNNNKNNNNEQIPLNMALNLWLGMLETRLGLSSSGDDSGETMDALKRTPYSDMSSKNEVMYCKKDDSHWVTTHMAAETKV